MLKQKLNNWTKVIVLIFFTGMTIVFAGCTMTNNIAQIAEGNPWAEDEHYIYPLLFNTPNIVYVNHRTIFSLYRHFHVNLTEEQLSTAFPTLDFDIVQIYRAEAFCTKECGLIEVVLRFNSGKISIGVRGQPNVILTAYGFEDDFILQQSYVHGVPVTAYIIDEDSDWASFRTFFSIGDENFFIQLNSPTNGRAQMTELVNMLIMGGTEGLAILENPVIPEILMEALSLTEAMADETFGAFVPRNIPDGFEPRWFRRSILGHVNENMLAMDWEK